MDIKAWEALIWMLLYKSDNSKFLHDYSFCALKLLSCPHLAFTFQTGFLKKSQTMCATLLFDSLINPSLDLNFPLENIESLAVDTQASHKSWYVTAKTSTRYRLCGLRSARTVFQFIFTCFTGCFSYLFSRSLNFPKHLAKDLGGLWDRNINRKPEPGKECFRRS